MSYTPSFNPSYNAWHDLPTEDTPVTAAVMANYDTAIENIESFLDGSTAIKPVEKTGLMTQNVGVDSNGALWTTPSGGGGASTADAVSYDNTESGMTATDVQDAIDELASGGGGAVNISYDSTESGLDATNVQDAIDELASSGGSTATEVSYSNTTSHLSATNVQSAIDEVVANKNTFTNITVGTRATGTTIGKNSTTEGYNLTATGDYSHAEGQGTKVIAARGHAEGFNTEVGKQEVTFGDIYGVNAHAEGQSTKAYGHNSHAEGDNTTTATHTYGAHSEGCRTQANANYSHAEGYYTQANGSQSHSSGNYTIAGSDSQFVCGKYNDNQSTNLFEIGNGTGTSARSNAFTVSTDGNVSMAGAITATDVTTLSDSDYIYLSISGTMKKITLANLKTVLGI